MLIPIKITIVADDCAARATSFDNFLSDVVPVITQKLSEIPRFVKEIPWFAGTAIEDEIPGTTNVGIPKLSIYSISSLPRPKIKESPPFKRTTFP